MAGLEAKQARLRVSRKSGVRPIGPPNLPSRNAFHRSPPLSLFLALLLACVCLGCGWSGRPVLPQPSRSLLVSVGAVWQGQMDRWGRSQQTLLALACQRGSPPSTASLALSALFRARAGGARGQNRQRQKPCRPTLGRWAKMPACVFSRNLLLPLLLIGSSPHVGKENVSGCATARRPPPCPALPPSSLTPNTKPPLAPASLAFRDG